jgi:hypothetical protein
VSCATAKPCAGCWLKTVSTVHSGSDKDSRAFMNQSVAVRSAVATFGLHRHGYKLSRHTACR